MRRPGSNALTTRLSCALAAMAALIPGMGVAREAAPQSVTASEAPVRWVRYAEAAATELSAWLEEESEAATRVRAYLHAARPVDGQPAPPLLLKVWIDDEGLVDRLEFTPFAHEEVNADLRAAVLGRRLAPPPPDMLSPLRIAVELTPKPEPEPAI